MGQLFNRLRSFVRASVSDSTGSHGTSWANQMLDADDEELRRIIDELNADASSTSSHRRQSPPRDNDRTGPQQQLPPDVLRAHTVLNVPAAADAATIKSAYRSCIAQWHPDRHSRATPEAQAHAHQRAREINEAYVILKKFYSIS
ncbi:MAG: DnaJ domain [Bacteroidota bacterium]|jgi:DnaJ-domain-containing protein 1